ncbi:MAG: hypothetical protein IPJ81_10485 [Chitinophagaceae bacterium]|nr:hypothetical protein [Chitinophagaceae bacterium]
MTKKKWALLILFAIAIFGYIKFFYKTYNETNIAQSADCIIALDVKKITNTIIWNTITTPSQWKTGNIFSPGSSDEVNWKDMVKIPDYIFTFHVRNQPANTWHTVLQVKDENDFTKGLQHYNFKKLNNNEYFCEKFGILIFKDDDKILVTNASVENHKYLLDVAHELFTKKTYIAKETIKKIIAAKSHMAVHIKKNSFLQEDAIITGNFDKNKIEINGTIKPHKQYSFPENYFSYPDSSLCSIGFTQPSRGVYLLLEENSKNKISKALDMNIDSLFLENNKSYSVDLAAIESRADSAITYAYDDDFNKVEKVVVNNIDEPVFNFIISGSNADNIYTYFNRTGKLEKTNKGELFTGMPLVKSYCSITNKNELQITSDNYQFLASGKNINCMLCMNLFFTKIPSPLLKYLPDSLIKTIKNLSSLQIFGKKEKDQILVNCKLNKKKNDLPLIY